MNSIEIFRKNQSYIIIISEKFSKSEGFHAAGKMLDENGNGYLVNVFVLGLEKLGRPKH